MRRSVILAAAVGGLMASSSFAAYTFSFTNDESFTTSGFDRYVLFALGTGAQANDPIFAADITLNTVNNGLKFSAPIADPDTGEPGSVPVVIANPATAPRTRANSLIFQTIAPGFPLPSNTADGGADFGAYAAGLNSFQIVGFDGRPGGPGVPVDASQNGGRGAAIIAAVVPDGAPIPTFSMASNVSGRSGFIQVVSFGTTMPPTNAAPVVTVAPSAIAVDVSPAGLEGFTAVVTATDTDLTGLALTSGLSGTAIADNVVLAGGTTGPLTVTGSNLTFADLGTYTLTFTGTDAAGGTGTGTLTITIVPEPATLSLVGLAALGMIRRRK